MLERRVLTEVLGKKTIFGGAIHNNGGWVDTRPVVSGKVRQYGVSNTVRLITGRESTPVAGDFFCSQLGLPSTRLIAFADGRAPFRGEAGVWCLSG